MKNLLGIGSTPNFHDIILNKTKTDVSEILIENKNDINKITLDFLEKNKGSSINDYDWGVFKEDFQKKSIRVSQIFTKKEKYINDQYDGSKLIKSSDSNVFLVNDKEILKIYDEISLEELKKYHDLQNKLSEENFEIEEKGKLEGIKFNKINIQILKLGDSLNGNNNYSYSIIKNKIGNYKYNTSNFILDNLRSNKYNINLPQIIDRMNIQIDGVYEGVLQLTITDIADNIKNFLDLNKNFDDNK